MKTLLPRPMATECLHCIAFKLEQVSSMIYDFLLFLYCFSFWLKGFLSNSFVSGIAQKMGSWYFLALSFARYHTHWTLTFLYFL